MALSVSGEFEIEAPQEQVMAALADVERIPEWSVVHKKVVVESDSTTDAPAPCG